MIGIDILIFAWGQNTLILWAAFVWAFHALVSCWLKLKSSLYYVFHCDKTGWWSFSWSVYDSRNHPLYKNQMWFFTPLENGAQQISLKMNVRQHKINLLFPVLWRLKKWCACAIISFIFYLFYKVKLRFLRQEWLYIFHISCKMYFYHRSRS